MMSSSRSERTLLHLVARGGALADALALCRPGDALLLLQDAVLAALANSPQARSLAAGACRVHALQPDLLARGFGDAPLLDGIERVDYAAMVALAAAHSASLTWA